MNPRLLSIFLLLVSVLCSMVAVGSPAAGAISVRRSLWAYAQSPDPNPKQNPAQNQDEVVRLRSRLVLVPVSVSDASGKPVRDLTASDFVIEENGRSQEIAQFGKPGEAPLDIALLFDVSGSIHAQFVFEQQAATRFITEVLKPGDGVAVFSIGAIPKLVEPRTANRDKAIAGLTAIQPSNEPTAFFDSIVDAAKYLAKNAEPGSRRVVLVVSDGEENFSVRSGLADALKQLQETDCLFYSINPSGASIKLNRISVKGQSNMEAMSTQTGGKAFLPEKTDELPGVFTQIADELKAQYMFGYYATDERADSGFKRITVHVANRADLRVRARQGYYPPKP